MASQHRYSLWVLLLSYYYFHYNKNFSLSWLTQFEYFTLPLYSFTTIKTSASLGLLNLSTFSSHLIISLQQKLLASLGCIVSCSGPKLVIAWLSLIQDVDYPPNSPKNQPTLTCHDHIISHHIAFARGSAPHSLSSHFLPFALFSLYSTTNNSN